MDTNWADIISTIGFPIVVALYFMFRFEKVLGRVVEVLARLEAHLDRSTDGNTKRRARSR